MTKSKALGTWNAPPGFHGGDKVFLLEPHYVTRWGYENDFQTELIAAAKECGIEELSQDKLSDSRIDELLLGVMCKHAEFAPIRPHIEALQKSAACTFRLPSIIRPANTSTVSSTHLTKLVKESVILFIRNRLAKYQVTGRRRELFFAPLPQYYEQFRHALWRIVERRVVTTGVYDRGSYSGGDDAESASLQEQKKHVLYQVTLNYVGQGPILAPLWMRACDLQTWREHEKAEQVAKRLMQFP
jgi:hypothetical protein